MDKEIREETSGQSVNMSDNVAADRALILAAREGDKAAYGKMVLKYQKRLFRFVYMLMRSKDLAEDVVQEAFVKGYLALGTFEPERPFYAWISTIARNLALNQLKKEEREKPASEFEDMLESVPDTRANPLERIMSEEIDRRFAGAVMALPAQYRAVFILRAFERMSYEEIGRELNISPGTVDSRIHRARQKLVELLKEYL